MHKVAITLSHAFPSGSEVFIGLLGSTLTSLYQFNASELKWSKILALSAGAERIVSRIPLMLFHYESGFKPMCALQR